MSEWRAEETLEQIRGILGQTTRRRHVHHADGAFLDWLEPQIAEVQRKLDHLRGQLNGFNVLPSPPPTPPPETRDMDQDSPSIPPSIGAESEIRQSAPTSESFVPETQLHTQPDSESVPSSIPASVNPGIVNPGIEDGWRGRGLMAFTEMRENWTEGHPKSTDLTWMDTQTEDNDKPDDNDKLPDLIQIDGD
jgi:hypothetical protein